MNGMEITRLYGRLRGAEAASLAFAAIATDNETEAERIGAALPLHQATAYTERMHALHRLAACYGLRYWQMRCALVGAVSMRLHLRENPTEGQEWQDRRMHLSACLVALERALEEVCGRHGVDPAAIRRMAETDPEVASGFDPDPEALERAREAFANVMGGGA
jgi:hypothetical protein